MPKNSYPNNDSKQCTVSKLGRVHSAHTQGPGCAHSAVSRALGAVSQRHVAVLWAVSQRCVMRCCIVSQCRVVAPYRNTKLCRDTKSCHALGRIAAPCRTLLPLAPTRLLGREPGHASPGPACRDTTHCIATKTGKWA